GFAEIGLHCAHQVVHLVGDGFEGGASEMRACRTTCDAGDEPPRPRVPVRGAEPRQRRNEEHAFARGDLFRELLYLRGGLDETQAIAQPPDRRARDERAALERVDDLAPNLPPNGGQEPGATLDYLRTGVHDDERSGPVGAFHVPDLKARLPEEGGLL